MGCEKKTPQSGRFQGFGGEGHHQQLVASRNARMGSAEKDRTYHAGACKRHGICPPPQRIRSHHDLQPVMSAPQCRKPSLNARTYQGPSASASPSPTPRPYPSGSTRKNFCFVELACGNRVRHSALPMQTHEWIKGLQLGSLSAHFCNGVLPDVSKRHLRRRQ